MSEPNTAQNPGKAVVITADQINVKNGYCYWSNSCGDLHHWTQCDLEEKDLPEKLHTAYKTLFLEGEYGPFFCYLVEWQREFGFAIEYEYTYDEQNDTYDNGMSMDDIVRKADNIASRHPFPVVVLPNLGIAGENEYLLSCNISIIFPCGSTVEDVKEIAKAIEGEI